MKEKAGRIPRPAFRFLETCPTRNQATSDIRKSGPATATQRSAGNKYASPCPTAAQIPGIRSPGLTKLLKKSDVMFSSPTGSDFARDVLRGPALARNYPAEAGSCANRVQVASPVDRVLHSGMCVLPLVRFCPFSAPGDPRKLDETRSGAQGSSSRRKTLRGGSKPQFEVLGTSATRGSDGTGGTSFPKTTEIYCRKLYTRFFIDPENIKNSAYFLGTATRLD